MSQFSPLRRISAICLALCFGALIASLTGGPVFAGELRGESGAETVVKASLSDMSGQQKAQLDWRNPVARIELDVPEGVWIDELELFLSATPVGSVSATTPLLVSLNGGPPQILHSEGHAFEAQMILRKADLRTGHNYIEITYKTPSGADCLLPDHGLWEIDLARSSARFSLRDRARSMYLSEIMDRLGHPLTAPNRVIITNLTGDDGNDARLAQALALRMDNVPEFSLGGRKGDLRILAGTRPALSKYYPASELSPDSRDALLYKSGKIPVLILTGDTDADVERLITAFSLYQVPDYTAQTQSSRLEIQSPLKPRPNLSGKTRLSDLGPVHFEEVYRPEAPTLSFQVSSPGQPGEIRLDLSRGTMIAPDSRVDVLLNGRPLGFTYLDRAEKKVLFDIPAGVTRASANQVSFHADMQPVTGTYGCVHQGGSPELAVLPRSYISFEDGASGGVLSVLRTAPASQMELILPSGKTDREAALRTVAALAQLRGEVLGSTRPATALTRIYIGTPSELPADLLSAAPRSLTDNLGLTPPVSEAALDNQLLSDWSSLSGGIGGGDITALDGMAALVTRPGGRTDIILTARSDARFERAIRALDEPSDFDNFSGDVVGWNRNQAVILQTAEQPLDSLAAAESSGTSSPWWAQASQGVVSGQWLDELTYAAETHLGRRGLLILLFGFLMLAIVILLTPSGSKKSA